MHNVLHSKSVTLPLWHLKFDMPSSLAIPLLFIPEEYPSHHYRNATIAQSASTCETVREGRDGDVWRWCVKHLKIRSFSIELRTFVALQDWQAHVDRKKLLGCSQSSVLNAWFVQVIVNVVVFSSEIEMRLLNFSFVWGCWVHWWTIWVTLSCCGINTWVKWKLMHSHPSCILHLTHFASRIFDELTDKHEVYKALPPHLAAFSKNHEMILWILRVSLSSSSHFDISSQGGNGWRCIHCRPGLGHSLESKTVWSCTNK